VHDRKASPERQYDGMVGCTACANICPTQAIAFPDQQLVQKFERAKKTLVSFARRGWNVFDDQ
jgi:formate hydrogenlyase subunit 6/NADH:ubiquinone oxidoreductase subunit I